MIVIINYLLIITAGIILIGGFLTLLFLLWKDSRHEKREHRIEKDITSARKFIPAAKELSYATGNIFKLRKYRTDKYKIQEKDRNLLDANLTKIVYGE